MNLRGLIAATLLLVLGMARADTVRDIDHYTSDRFAHSGLPGLAVVVVQQDKVIYARAFGSDGKGGAVGLNTPFILGSTSKSFTALAILQLVETRRVRFDDPVAGYVDGFLGNAPEAHIINVRMLLNQTSGLSHEAGDQPVLDAGETGPDAIRNWVRRLDARSLNRAPRTSYEYSNANYVVLGAIIEKASGMRYRDYMRTHVFAPLGMSHTVAQDTPDRAHGHRQFFGLNTVYDLPYPESFVPAGFIVSTANDLAKYLSAQLPGSANARKLGLSDEYIALWHKGVAPMDDDGKSHYAMGWAADTFAGVPVVYHSGDTGVFSSELTLEPKGRYGVIVLANGSGWLASNYLQEISSGAVNILNHRKPRDDGVFHWIVLAIYLAVLALPLGQALALWLMRNRRPGLVGRTWPVVLHLGVAWALLLALPRGLFGIPFAELWTSFPDMAMAAILSGMLALAALAQAIFFQRPTAV